MTLLWAVPVLAAAVATTLVALAARPIGDELTALAHEVGRVDALRRRLAAVRAEVGDPGLRAAARSAGRRGPGDGSPAD